jgi:hypothetical protein
MKNNTDSFELSYLRSMIEGLSNLLNISVKNRDWPLVELVASEIEQALKDAKVKAEKNIGKAA